MSQDNNTPPPSAHDTSNGRLAALVGFNEKITDLGVRPPTASTVHADVENGVSPEEDSPRENSPRDTPTVRPQWGRATNKAYLVLAISAVVMLIGYVAAAHLMGSPVKKQAKSAKKLQEFPIPATEVEDQTGKIKASLAFGDQVEAINKLNSENQQKAKPPASPVSKAQKPKPVAPQRETPRNTRIVSSVPPLSPRPVPLRQPQPARVTTPAVAKTPEPQPDPLAVWQQLAQTGSYGQTSGGVKEDVLVADATSKNQASAIGENQQASVVDSGVGNVPALDKGNITTKPAITATAATIPTTATATQEPEPLSKPLRAMQEPETLTSEPLKVDEVAEAAVLSGQPIRTATLLTATTAKARLTTPLSWSDDLTATTAPQLALQLEQPLQASDGKAVFPIGTRLIAQVNSVSTSGLVEATVISMVVSQGRDTQEIALSPGAIVLTGSKGMPLIAKAKQQKQPGGGVNVGQVLKDVLDQRYEDIPESLSRRSSRASSGSGTLWYLAAGEPIELFVNQRFQLNLP